MSLGGALQIGRSGLLANQMAIEVAGNNLANIATKGYHRQNIALEPSRDQELARGIFIGRGVQIQSIVRQIDEALESRIRTSVADESAASARGDVLGQIEAIQNELSGHDISTQLGAFFNAWSELANRPLDNSLRTLVIQSGRTLADYLQTLRGELGDLRYQTDQSIDQAVAAADDLLTRIGELNSKIAEMGASGEGANSLRDQRDLLLSDLAQYLDISVREQASGAVDVFVGSLPVVLNGQSRGIEVRRQTIDGDMEIDVVLGADGSVLNAASGKIGALITARRDDINAAIDTVDQFTKDLIWQVNLLYSQGQGVRGFSSISSDNQAGDATAALNSDAAGLDFVPSHGSFQIHVTQRSTGERVTTTINVDLDGIDAANDTTLTSLAAALDAVGNISAGVTGDRRLAISADTGDYEISFSDDNAGVLAALGINTFFSGKDATTVAVNDVITATPSHLAAGRQHVSGDNRNALELASLRGMALDDLGGLSLTNVWNRHVEDYAVRLSQSNQQVTAASVVKAGLEAQQQAASGVNTDEETIDLLTYQRAYQASARFLTVVDDMMQTLLGLL